MAHNEPFISFMLFYSKIKLHHEWNNNKVENAKFL